MKLKDLLFRNKHLLKEGRSFDLGKMNLKDLWKAYLTYPTIQFYFFLITVTGSLSLYLSHDFWGTFLPIPIVVLVFPMVWYIIHRWIMHGRLFYRNPLTSAIWKRIHWDHHQDPHLLEVLFGSPLHTVPTMVGIAMPIGGLIGGWSGAFSALMTSVIMGCIYEFFHCIQHLAYKPKTAWVNYIKQLHVLHHFHDEDGNFGITNYFYDRLFSTFYRRAKDRQRSPWVFNLGYTMDEAERYPWVMEQTGHAPKDRPDPARMPAIPEDARNAH